MSGSNLQVKSSRKETEGGKVWTILESCGDIQQTADFEEAVKDAISSESTDMVINFANLKVRTDLFPGLLTRLADLTEKNQCQLRLVALPQEAISFFAMIQMLEFFQIYPTEQDAIEDTNKITGP